MKTHSNETEHKGDGQKTNGENNQNHSSTTQFQSGPSYNDGDNVSNAVVNAVCNVLMSDTKLPDRAWHQSGNFEKTRRTMEQCVIHLIWQRRPSATQDWVEKLPDVARKVEQYLFHSASSIDE